MANAGSMRGAVPVAFISSTSDDLRPSREAAREAALEADFLPRMMEYFVASGARPPLPACLEKVSEADVVVVIVAHRYGRIPADQTSGRDQNTSWRWPHARAGRRSS